MIVTLKIKTDLLEQTTVPVIMVPQNDGACRMLELTLYAGAEPWTVPEGASVRLHYRKPGDTGGSYDALPDGSPAWTAESNMLTITLAPQMFTTPGYVTAKIEFIRDDRFLHTFDFCIRVVEDGTVYRSAEGDYFNWSSWTCEELARLLEEAKASGDFTGEQGYSPVRGTDYWTLEDQAWIAGEISQEIAAQLAGRSQLAPEFADSIAGCTDASKLYVLPDGYLYACMYSETIQKAYTNLAGTVQINMRLNSSGQAVALDGCIVTDFIPVTQGQVVRIQGLDPTSAPNGTYAYICYYTGADESAVVTESVYARGDWTNTWIADGDGYRYNAFYHHSVPGDHPLSSSITHIRISGIPSEEAEIIVTVDEEIAENAVGSYAWGNTGHAFVAMDYEDRIIALEDAVKAKEWTGKKWTGKKWAAVGDSLTYDEYATTSAYYHDHIAETTGITVVNMGQGGTGYKRTFNTGEGYAFFQRIVHVPADVDVVTIFGGGNDLSTTWETYGLGDVTDTGTDTICGCINTTLDNLFSVLPMANLGIITPTPWKHFYPAATTEKASRMNQLCEKLVEICRLRSIPCLDLYHCSGLRPWDKTFRDAVYTKDVVESDGELGGVHPDENGHKVIATKIKTFLENLLD